MLIIIGLLIGLILGLTGAGGSVFAVPLLLLFARLPMTDATGIALGAVAASTIFGSTRNFFRKESTSILWKPGVILALTGAAFAPIGKWSGLKISEIFSEQWLIAAFSALAIIIATRLWLSANKNPEAARIVRAGNFAQLPSPDALCNLSRTGQFELKPRCVGGLLIGGIVVGLLSGLFGVGGGFLIVPLLLALSAVSMAQAVSTSIFIIAVISSSGFISYLWMSNSDSWELSGMVAIGGILGMIIGQAVSLKIANAVLQKIFSISLILVVIISFLRSL
jgi:uncharacterized protein